MFSLFCEPNDELISFEVALLNERLSLICAPFNVLAFVDDFLVKDSWPDLSRVSWSDGLVTAFWKNVLTTVLTQEEMLSC